jgi:NhaP-type Na+/H+ or K+/H+ antiporter/CRP-like cAMP-binding protein
VHDSIEFRAIAIACLVLAFGVGARLFARKLRLPYTVAMLLAGAAAAFGLDRFGSAGAPDQLAHWLTPDLIIFVFLPALVYESATALDAHAFWKERSALGLLAAPALLVSAGLVAASMVALTAGTWEWSWPVALVFGALISATDPVAVVALLREVGAPKRLGVLIEGESLLNDGTSIVVFTVLVGLLAEGQLSVAHGVVDFLRVVAGGALVGFGVAFFATLVLTRTFNDALVEIPVTLVVAYAAMILAEGVLHVSGVIAVVVAGLWMGGRGRTAVSPEVRGPLHHFWELLAHIANTLIFFLVGMLIWRQLEHAAVFDLVLILAAFIAVILVRFTVTFSFLPVMRALGGRVSVNESLVMSWSGLRGAVSLALALIVCQQPGIAPGVQRDILLATAGVVLLTIMINGNTAGLLLKKLGFSKRPLSETLGVLRASSSVIDRVLSRIEVLSRARDLRPLDWTEVRAELAVRQQELDVLAQKAEDELRGGGDQQQHVGAWVHALRLERESYWKAFSDGTLGARAVRLLDLEVDRHLDRLALGDLEPPRSRTDAAHAGLADRAFAWIFSRTVRARASRLALIYDLERGEVQASERVLAGLAALGGEQGVHDDVERHYRLLLDVSTQRLEEMRANHPELVRAVEARLARRLALNLEREELRKLVSRGVLDETQGHVALGKVQRRMKALFDVSLHGELPTVPELLSRAPLFDQLPERLLHQLSEEAKEHVAAPGEVIFDQGDRGTGVFVIARGAVHIYREGEKPAGDDQQEGRRLVDILGAGQVFGEMAFVSGAPRSATVQAATSATLLELPRAALIKAISRDARLEERLYADFAERSFDAWARRQPTLAHMSRDHRREWFHRCQVRRIGEGEKIPRETAALVFVASGTVTCGDDELHAPCGLEGEQLDVALASSEVRIALLPSRPDADADAAAE